MAGNRVSAILRADSNRLRGGRLPRILCALALLGCTEPVQPKNAPPTGLPPELTAKELLPADLDVMLWLDLSRVKQFWLRDSEQALLGILSEYSLLPGQASEDERAYWLEALKSADRLWLACRPRPSGCEDPVAFLRGDFAQFEPRRLPQTELALDLGGGWLRFDRAGATKRSELARVYYAPPDRVLFVSYAERDAVERTVERRLGSRSIAPSETGVASLVMRPKSVAELVARRSPAAARWLRDAQTLELGVRPASDALLFEVTVVFETEERAERAGRAFQLLRAALAKDDVIVGLDAEAIQVIGAKLTLRLTLRPPEPQAGGAGAPPASPQQSGPTDPP